jgi:iron complex transport system permease protein
MSDTSNASAPAEASAAPDTETGAAAAAADLGLGARRLAGWLAASFAFALVACVLALLVDVDSRGGSHHLVLVDLRHLFDDSTAGFVFRTFRVPRVLAGLMVGAALASAGATFQAVLQNPLAEPYTLGVSSGSALAAVIAIRVGVASSALGYGGVGAAAMLGAALTVMLVYRLARIGNHLPAATLLLAGVTIAMFSSAASMLVQFTADFGEIYQMVRWMMGGLDVLAGPLARVSPFLLLGMALLVSRARALDALAAGPDAAASVGVDTRRTVTTSFVAASLLVGASIALAGPIGFVGLMVPHAVRALAGPDHRILLPAAMLVGGGFLVLCDAIGRLVLAPSEIPVGVVTALVGAPFFLYLLVGEKRQRRMWG